MFFFSTNKLVHETRQLYHSLLGQSNSLVFLATMLAVAGSSVGALEL